MIIFTACSIVNLPLTKILMTMSNKNFLGLDQDATTELAQKLNNLLANYTVFYMNVRGYHWNIKGEKFFELHAKFEEHYDDLFLKIDEIAERILTLGHTPLHSYTAFLQNSEIKAQENISEGQQCVEQIVEAMSTLISKQRTLLEISAKADDEGTNALMSDYVREQEKLLWMYRSFLGK